MDDEVEPYIENRGNDRVPSSIRVLLVDAEYKEMVLGELAGALEKEVDLHS